MSLGGLCGKSKFSSALMHPSIPSSSGMFVHRQLSSIVTSSVCGGRASDFRVFTNCLLSLMYEGLALITGCSSVSINCDICSVGPLKLETIGLSFLGSLCI